MDYPGSKGKLLHVEKNAREIEGLLKQIKRLMT